MKMEYIRLAAIFFKVELFMGFVEFHFDSWEYLQFYYSFITFVPQASTRPNI